MIRKYFFTFVTEFIVLLSGIWVYRLVAEIGTEQFSIYAITRRVVSLIQPVIMLGMAVALPRFIVSLKPAQKSNAVLYLVTSISIPIFLCFTLLIAAAIWPGFFSFTFFGENKYSFMSVPMFIMIAGLIIHTMVYGYNRGKMKITHANLMQLINMGLVPVVVLLVEEDIMKIVLYTGICWSILPILFLSPKFDKINLKIRNLISIGRDMTLFGLPRVPGDFAFAMLFALPPLIASHVSDLIIAGNVAFGITLLNIVTAAFAPISVILLPEARKMILDRAFDNLNKRIDTILKITLITTVVGVILFEFSAEYILNLYLGSASNSLITITKWLMPGAIGLAIFIGLRSILDAYYNTARNSKNILISFSIFVLLVFIILISNAYELFILPALVVSLSVLGILTYLNLRRIKLLAKIE